MLHLLPALVGGDALEATYEERDAPQASVVAEALRETADATDGKIGAESGTAPWHALEEDLAEGSHASASDRLEGLGGRKPLVGAVADLAIAAPVERALGRCEAAQVPVLGANRGGVLEVGAAGEGRGRP
jgi:hypothetical protein